VGMKQIFVFSEQAPCGRELADLLGAGTRLDALGWETDLDHAIRRIHEIHPPAVIVAGQDATTDCGPAVTRMQIECPGIQITQGSALGSRGMQHSREGSEPGARNRARGERSIGQGKQVCEM
jgi:hypothetical protein